MGFILQEIYMLKQSDGSCIAVKVKQQTLESAVMNCSLIASEKNFLLAAGVDGDCHLYTLRPKTVTPKKDGEGNTVELFLKAPPPFGHKNMVSQDRWSLVTDSFTPKCRAFCQKLVVLQDRWSVMAVVPQERFNCMLNL